jgi:hypothetical protein
VFSIGGFDEARQDRRGSLRRLLYCLLGEISRMRRDVYFFIFRKGFFDLMNRFTEDCGDSSPISSDSRSSAGDSRI